MWFSKDSCEMDAQLFRVGHPSRSWSVFCVTGRMTEWGVFIKLVFDKYKQEYERYWWAELELKLLAKEEKCSQSKKQFSWDMGFFLGWYLRRRLGFRKGPGAHSESLTEHNSLMAGCCETQKLTLYKMQHRNAALQGSAFPQSWEGESSAESSASVKWGKNAWRRAVWGLGTAESIIHGKWLKEQREIPSANRNFQGCGRLLHPKECFSSSFTGVYPSNEPFHWLPRVGPALLL